jgi:hypothetical protein
MWGDVDCDGSVNSVDALLILRRAAALEVDANCQVSNDVDCSGLLNSIDALKILRHVALLSVSQNQPCPAIGSVN